MPPTLIESSVVMYILCEAAADEEIKRLVSMLGRALTYADFENGEGAESFWGKFWNAVIARLLGSVRFLLSQEALVERMRPAGAPLHLGAPTRETLDQAYAHLPATAHRLLTMDLLWSVIQTAAERLVPALTKAQASLLLSPYHDAEARPHHIPRSAGARAELLRILLLEGPNLPIVIACLPDVRQQALASLKLALVRGDRMCSADVLLDILDPGDWENQGLLADEQTVAAAASRRRQILARMTAEPGYDPLLDPAMALPLPLQEVRKSRRKYFYLELLRTGHMLEEAMNDASAELRELTKQARSALSQLFPSRAAQGWSCAPVAYQQVYAEMKQHFGESFSHGAAVPLFRLAYLVLADKGASVLGAAMNSANELRFSFNEVLAQLVGRINQEVPAAGPRAARSDAGQQRALDFFARHARTNERVLWTLLFLCPGDDARSLDRIAPVFFPEKADPCEAALRAIHQARVHLWGMAANPQPPPEPTPPGSGIRGEEICSREPSACAQGDVETEGEQAHFDWDERAWLARCRQSGCHSAHRAQRGVDLEARGERVLGDRRQIIFFICDCLRRLCNDSCQVCSDWTGNEKMVTQQAEYLCFGAPPGIAFSRTAMSRFLSGTLLWPTENLARRHRGVAGHGTEISDWICHERHGILRHSYERQSPEFIC